MRSDNAFILNVFQFAFITLSIAHQVPSFPKQREGDHQAEQHAKFGGEQVKDEELRKEICLKNSYF